MIKNYMIKDKIMIP